MKLIIQIPCLNEKDTLPVTIKDLPRSLPGVDEIEYLVIDDGSTDGTAEAAKALGVRHVVRFTKRKGLAAAFMAGIDASVQLGADIIVNTDADNQYNAADIEKLIAPILGGRADYVVGQRPVNEIEHFSFIKKKLQSLGSLVVRAVSGTDIPDATSGFRALSRDAALKMNIFSEYTYTLETIIQAGLKGIAITSVPIRVNPQLRESRLIKSVSDYIKKSIITIFRIFMFHKPLASFVYLGATVFSMGLLIGVRFLYFYLTGHGAGHIQSLILLAVLLTIGFNIMVLGLVGDLISVNRRLIEDVQFRIRKMEIELKGSGAGREGSKMKAGRDDRR